MNSQLTTAMKEAAQGAGADLVGIASVERFDGVAAEHHPATIFPEVRSVIVLGKRITRGCLRGMEEGTQFGLYRTYGINWVPDRFLAMTTVTVASWLEDQRYEAVPLPDLPPEVPALGIPVREGAVAPNVMVDFIDAAVRAGLGEIGLTGELMTAQFGHLQKLQVILTDAKLEPTPLCEHEICDRCGRCASVCPLDAIDASDTTDIEICGKTMKVAAIDKTICLRCQNGASPNPKHPSGRPDILAALCMRTCVDALQKRSVLSKPFETSFRHRPAGAVNASGVVGEVKEDQS